MNCNLIRLKTAYQGALSPLESLILNQVPVIESWFREAWRHTQPPLMTSVDLRHAGFKLAPVDTNLFPAGFNNLNPDFLPMCVQAVQSVMAQFSVNCRRIVLVPEAHTRNTYYLESLKVLESIFIKAGFEVSIAHWEPAQLNIELLEREGNLLRVGGKTPCLVVLNNDLSSGIPPIFEGIEQSILPLPQLGWVRRKKSHHFELYREVVTEFAELLNCDPWLFYPDMAAVDGVNFMDKTGLIKVAEAVEAVLSKTKAKYAEYNIKERPFAVVKSENGTYGMGIMMVHDGESLLNLNRKQRVKMAASKGGQEVHQVLIQEGVYTLETMPDGATAEPVVYMIGQYVVGGFYRVHQGRGIDDNLNAPGMYFEPLAFDKPCNTPCSDVLEAVPANRFYVYGVVARLAALAAGKESLELEKKG